MRSSLYLVEEYERIAFRTINIGHGSYSSEYAVYVEILLKKILQQFHFLKIHISELLIMTTRKFLHNPGFAYLSRSFQYERFTSWILFPL